MMNTFDTSDLQKLYIPPHNSHKGQNGKLLLIGGSHLFHAASLWALHTASRIVDMVFYASVPENNKIVQHAKEEFRNGIVIQREDIGSYIEEADCILLGPGMMRTKVQSAKLKVQSIKEVHTYEDEGMQTYLLTKYLLQNYPHKKWVIDAGALQMLKPEWLLPLNGNVVLTPHEIEFKRVFKDASPLAMTVEEVAKEYNVTILLKGEEDTLCSPETCVRISGGNAGMTKGGTGDVLAGLIAALACKNDLFLAAQAGSYINKKAGEALFERVGYYFNASDLAEEIPKVMKGLLG